MPEPLPAHLPLSSAGTSTIPPGHHGGFAYVDGHLPDGTTLPLFRLRYGGSANSWGFAIHLASRNGYEITILPGGYPVGTPEEALDCACGLYLNDPTAGDQPRRTNGRDH